jgi:hypothetical protein
MIHKKIAFSKKVPINYISFISFTIFLAYDISYLCSCVENDFPGDGKVFIVAVAMTLGNTISLTIYTLISKDEVTKKGGYMFILIMSVILFGVSCLYPGKSTLNYFYCFIWAILYGLYMIKFTIMLVGGKK